MTQNVRAISLAGDAAPRPHLPLGYLGEITERDAAGRVHIFHGPWRPTEASAVRAAHVALTRRCYFPSI